MADTATATTVRWCLEGLMSLPAPQYDSLHKFVVSVGIALMVLPALLVHLLESGSYDLNISEEDYAALTPQAKTLFDVRVNVMQSITDMYVAIALVSVLVGLGMVAYGLYKWWPVQKEIDKGIVLDNKNKIADNVYRRLGMMSAGPVIKEAKTGADVPDKQLEVDTTGCKSIDSHEPHCNDNQITSVKSEPQATDDSDTQVTHSNQFPDFLLYDRYRSGIGARAFIEIDDAAFEYVAATYGDRYLLRTHQVMRHSMSAYKGTEYDIVGIPKVIGAECLVFEVKICFDGRVTAHQATAVMRQRVNCISDFRSQGFDVRFILLMAVTPGVSPDVPAIAKQLSMADKDIVVLPVSLQRSAEEMRVMTR